MGGIPAARFGVRSQKDRGRSEQSEPCLVERRYRSPFRLCRGLERELARASRDFQKPARYRVDWSGGLSELARSVHRSRPEVNWKLSHKWSLWVPASQNAEKLGTPSFRVQRGIPLLLLFLELGRRGIPRCARNEGLRNFFRKLSAATFVDSKHKGFRP